MARSHVISAVFLTLVSANMIQGGIIPQLFHEGTFPNLVNVVDIPRFGELSHNAASSAASATSNAFNDFKTYVDVVRRGFGRHIEIPPNYGALHRFVHGEIWPNFANRAVGVPSGQVVMPGLLGNYGGVDGGAASAAAASSAASGGGLAKR